MRAAEPSFGHPLCEKQPWRPHSPGYGVTLKHKKLPVFYYGDLEKLSFYVLQSNLNVLFYTREDCSYYLSKFF